MVGAAVGGAGMKAELRPEPFELRHGPGSDCRQADGADARAASMARFVFVMVLYVADLEAAGGGVGSLSDRWSAVGVLGRWDPKNRSRPLFCEQSTNKAGFADGRTRRTDRHYSSSELGLRFPDPSAPTRNCGRSPSRLGSEKLPKFFRHARYSAAVPPCHTAQSSLARCDG